MKYVKFFSILGVLLVGVAIIVVKRPGAVFDEKKPLVPTPLAKVVTQSLLGTQGTYGIAIKNLKTGESYYFNEHRVFQPGSLYKLWIMAVTYKQIESGDISQDEILSRGIAQLNTDFGIPSESAELTEGTLTISVHNALEQMITISHNYSAFLLTERVKLAAVQPFLDANNLKESNVGATDEYPTTTASDVALFFEKLYQGKLASKTSTEEMLGLLKAQQLNDVLPKYLPENVVVAHKTGNIDTFDNDAGIVYGPNGDYIIVLLSESDNPAGAEDRMAQMSKAVYDYFNPGSVTSK